MTLKHSLTTGIAVAAIAGSAHAALTTGLAAYYDMEGLTNKAQSVGSDYSGTFYDLTVAGGSVQTSFSGDAAWNSDAGGGTSDRSTLLVGNAANFDNASDRLNTTLGTAELGQNFTVSLWFYAALDPDMATRRLYPFEAENNYDISYGPGNVAATATSISMLAYNNQVSLNSSVSNVGEWNHLSFIVSQVDADTSHTKIFLNGILVTDLDNGAAAGLPDFTGINIGNARSGQNRGWEGMIDEVAIYNRSIDDSEAAQLYALGITGFSIPEPSTSLLIGLSGIAFILRRKR